MATLIRPILYIGLLLLALILLVLVQFQEVADNFAKNLAINLLILMVFLFGLCLSFWRLSSLAYEIDWLAQIRTATQASNADKLASPEVVRRLDLLASFAHVWRRFFDSNQVLTPALATTLVDSAQARLDERRELSRYLVTALVILGLLGTFWGLLGALGPLGDGLIAFDPDRDGLEGISRAFSDPLASMGTAFSSSLFGLAASIIFGFVELQTARAQNRFVEEFEAWLATLIQAGGAAATASGPSTFAQAKLGSEISGNLDGLTSLMRRSQQDTLVLNNNLVSLLDQISRVADKLTADQAIHEKIVATQADQSELIAKLQDLTATLQDLPNALPAPIVQVAAPLADPTPSDSEDESEEEEAKEPRDPVAGAFLQPDKG